ncbi:MAG: hypothetical protein U0136_15805 [Bdellovibrionota bacterium]
MFDRSDLAPLTAAVRPFVERVWKRKELIGVINDALVAVQSSLPKRWDVDPVLSDLRVSYQLLVDSLVVMQELERTPWGTHSPDTKLGKRLLTIHGTLRERRGADAAGLDAMDRYSTSRLHSSRLVFELLVVAPWEEFVANARDLCMLMNPGR